MNLEGKKVLVAGAGKSGIAAVELLQKKNVEVVLFEGNESADPDEIRGRSEALANVDLYIGSIPQDVEETIDIAVLSPGIPTDIPMVEALKKKNVAIWGEIELAYQCAKGKILAITGTNGKTTTTALLGEIMANYYADEIGRASV